MTIYAQDLWIDVYYPKLKTPFLRLKDAGERRCVRVVKN
jgi:hypothetical protein